MTTPNNIVVLNTVENPEKKVLFLGYDESQTKIISALIDANCEVHHTEEPIGIVSYDLIVSFGYRHIITKKTITGTSCPILNLHISYLPYNRGAHPNFWSFYEKTPSGVTIHVVDDGIDTGPIVYQRHVNFGTARTTFSETRQALIAEIEDLFLNNLDNILENKWEAKAQQGSGSSHYTKDLPGDFQGWDSDIETELKRLYKVLGK